MIFKLLRISKAYKKNDLSGLASDQVSDVLSGLFVVPLVITALVLVLLFLLGFTSILGGPFGLAKFFFIIVLIPSVFMFFLMKKLLSATKRTTASVVRMTEKKVYDILPVEKDI